MGTTRILLVDPYKMFREGVRHFLAKNSNLLVVGEASNGSETIEMVRSQRPDLVIMEIVLEHLSGLDVVSKRQPLCPDLSYIGLTSQRNELAIQRAFQAGISGYVLKLDGFEILLKAIRAVIDGHRYLSLSINNPDIKAAIADRSGKGLTKSKILTARETQVLRMVSDGLSTQNIAQLHHISTRTVETHRQRIMKKLGIDHLPGLTKYALKEGLTNLDG